MAKALQTVTSKQEILQAATTAFWMTYIVMAITAFWMTYIVMATTAFWMTCIVMATTAFWMTSKRLVFIHSASFGLDCRPSLSEGSAAKCCKKEIRHKVP